MRYIAIVLVLGWLLVGCTTGSEGCNKYPCVYDTDEWYTQGDSPVSPHRSPDESSERVWPYTITNGTYHIRCITQVSKMEWWGSTISCDKSDFWLPIRVDGALYLVPMYIMAA